MKLDKILESRNIGYSDPLWGRTPPGYNDPDPTEIDNDNREDVVAEYLDDEIFNDAELIEPLKVVESKLGNYKESRRTRRLYKAVDKNSRLNKHFDNMNALEEVFMFKEDAQSFLSKFDRDPVSALMEYAFVNDIEWLKKHKKLYDRVVDRVEEHYYSGDWEPKALQDDGDYY